MIILAFNDSFGEPARRRLCLAVRPAQVVDPSGWPQDIPGREGSAAQAVPPAADKDS